MSAVPPPRRHDHLVLAARDLAAQAAFYEKLGFSVGARNRHPWGTENHIVQFDGAFLELISTGKGFVPPVDVDPHVFSFPRGIADFLARREGFYMLALGSDEARADAKHFRALGLGGFEPFHFERHGRGADGRDVTVGFTLAFAASKLIPDAGFFVCQQHHPENFWNPALQRHANGARRLVSAVMVADGPSDHAEFLSHFTGQREMNVTSMGIEIELAGGGRIEVLTPLAFAYRFGAAAAPGHGAPHFAAFRVGVADLQATQALLARNAVALERRERQLVVPAASGFGVAISFEPL